MTKLAVFVPSLVHGGMQRAMLNVANEFAERGLDCDLVMVRAEGEYMSLVSPKLNVVDFKAARTLGTLPAMIRYLRQTRPDYMVVVSEPAQLVALWARALTRVDMKIAISVQHTSSVFTQHAKQLKEKLYPFFTRHTFPMADYVFTVSEGVGDDLARFIDLPRERIKTIYNPAVTPDIFDKAVQAVDHEWYINHDCPVVIAVGRLSHEKRQSVLIRAFAKVRQDRAARLVVLGEGPERPSLEALISELGLKDCIDLYGYSDNPFAFLAKSDVFVLTSIYEGLPTVIIEALACGCPVVSTDCPSGPREILDHGAYGALVSVDDVDGLAQAILTTLDNPPNKADLKERAQEFSVDKVVDKYLDVFGIG